MIDPCNVLVIDPVTLTYSFGHFRFQEHMVAEELMTNRNRDLVDLLIDDWWRGSLSLYAQNTNMSHLIEDAYKRYGNLNRSAITLEVMIENSSPRYRNDFLDILSRYKDADESDDIFNNDYQRDDYEVYDYLVR